MDNHDFLDGIDEQFQKLMKLQKNGKSSNGNSRSHSNEESVTSQIMALLPTLTRAQREEVLAFVKSLREKVEG